MSQYVGLDVSLKAVSVCVVAEDGSIVRRATLPTDPKVIASFIVSEAPKAARVVHESGILSIWLTRELVKRDLPLICIDARMAHKALSARLNKSDKADAEGLAQLARTGWFTEVHIRSETSDRVRAVIAARKRLIGSAKSLRTMCAAF